LNIITCGNALTGYILTAMCRVLSMIG